MCLSDENIRILLLGAGNLIRPEMGTAIGLGAFPSLQTIKHCAD